MREGEGCIRKREREGGMRERDKLSVFVFLKLVSKHSPGNSYII